MTGGDFGEFDIIEPEELYPQEKLSDKIKKVDGWPISSSDRISGSVKIEKERTGGLISVHLDPLNNRFYKIAESQRRDARIEKEHACWQNALAVFEVDDYVYLKNAGSRRCLVMPYVGIRLKYFEDELPGRIPPVEIPRFIERMLILVRDYGQHHLDLNDGNIMVRVKDGKIKLFPIDWESARVNIPIYDREKHARVMAQQCYNAFIDYYPELKEILRQ